MTKQFGDFSAGSKFSSSISPLRGSASEELAKERAVRALHPDHTPLAGTLWTTLVELALEIATRRGTESPGVNRRAHPNGHFVWLLIGGISLRARPSPKLLAPPLRISAIGLGMSLSRVPNALLLFMLRSIRPVMSKSGVMRASANRLS